MWYLLYRYKVTTKHTHWLYYVITVVDNNLKIKFFIIGDVKYPVAQDCEWIDLHMCLVIQDKCEQVIVTCVHCLHCETTEISL